MFDTQQSDLATLLICCKMQKNSHTTSDKLKVKDFNMVVLRKGSEMKKNAICQSLYLHLFMFI